MKSQEKGTLRLIETHHNTPELIGVQRPMRDLEPTLLELIRAAKEGELLWDKGEKSSVKGLHLRVTATTKNFFLYYRTKTRRERRPKIGEFGDITLGEARRRAKLILDRVATGEDPSGDWAAKRKEYTIQELFDKTVTDHWDTPRYRASGRLTQVKDFYKNHLKTPFGNRLISEVTPLTVREWHRQYSTNKTTVANRALEVLSKVFQYAEEQELRGQNSNPCKLVKAHPERKRKRFATLPELKTISPLIEQEAEAHPAGVAFLYMLIFSGSRPSAIERAGWDQLREFEIEGQPYGILTFKGKSTADSGELEQVILPPQAMNAIKKLPRIEGYTITGIKFPRRLWHKIREKAGCGDLWARDWRRTFATVGMSGGVNKSIIAELLNQKSEQTTSIYAKLMDGPRLVAATSIANHLEKLMKKDEDGVTKKDSD